MVSLQNWSSGFRERKFGCRFGLQKSFWENLCHLCRVMIVTILSEFSSLFVFILIYLNIFVDNSLWGSISQSTPSLREKFKIQNLLSNLIEIVSMVSTPESLFNIFPTKDPISKLFNNTAAEIVIIFVQAAAARLHWKMWKCVSLQLPPHRGN